MKQTTTYKLNLIENTDLVSPSPLNLNFEMLDALLKATNIFVGLGYAIADEKSDITWNDKIAIALGKLEYRTKQLEDNSGGGGGSTEIPLAKDILLTGLATLLNPSQALPTDSVLLGIEKCMAYIRKLTSSMQYSLVTDVTLAKDAASWTPTIKLSDAWKVILIIDSIGTSSNSAKVQPGTLKVNGNTVCKLGSLALGQGETMQSKVEIEFLSNDVMSVNCGEEDSSTSQTASLGFATDNTNSGKVNSIELISTGLIGANTRIRLFKRKDISY